MVYTAVRRFGAFFPLVVLYLELSCGLSLISPCEPTPRWQLPRSPWSTQVCLSEDGQRCSTVAGVKGALAVMGPRGSQWAWVQESWPKGGPSFWHLAMGMREPALAGALPIALGDRAGMWGERVQWLLPLSWHLTMACCFYGSLSFLHKYSQL